MIQKHENYINDNIGAENYGNVFTDDVKIQRIIINNEKSCTELKS